MEGDGAARFRQRFNGYYGVRRNAEWRAEFYRQFSAAQRDRSDRKAIFARVLAAIHTSTERVEASFASKLVATLQPGGPIIDSIVRRFLGQHGEAPKFGGGLENALAYYEWLDKLTTALVETDEAAAWAADFDRAFAGVPGARDIHIVKKIDFLIWAGTTDP